MKDLKKVAFISYKVSSNLIDYIENNLIIRNISIKNNDDISKLNSFNFCIINISEVTDLNETLKLLIKKINSTNCKLLGFYIVNSSSLSETKLNDIYKETKKLLRNPLILKDEDSIKVENRKIAS